MFESLMETFSKGMEYAYATTDKIEKAAKEFAKENNLNKEEAKKVLDHWLKRSVELKDALEKQIVELQKSTIAKMNLVTKDEYLVLEARIKKLEGSGIKPAKITVKAKPVKKVAKKKPVK
jgi:polyhydroxyalkanoate synthesis regulator phasin